MKTIALIVAGGSGTRFGAQVPKQFVDLNGKPILLHTIQAFDNALSHTVHEIVVTLPADQMQQWQQLCDEHHGDVPQHRVVAGGSTRWHSVRNGLDAVADLCDDNDVIAVHDGVRPLASATLIRQVVAAARERGSAVPVVKVNDTMRELERNGVSHTLDRSLLRAVQTPQAFRAGCLLAAYRQPHRDTFTDDASVVEACGNTVMLVPGEYTNIKITRPMDLALASLLLNHG